MENPVLFVTYGGGHVHMVTSVAKALSRRPDAPPIVALGLPAALFGLRAAGLKTISFRDLLDPEEDADALEWGAKLAEAHHSPHTGIPLDESVAYLGLSYKDLVTRYGADEAETWMAERGRHAFRPITILDRALDRLTPRTVITTNSPRAEAAAIDAAKARGIPNIVMSDLFTGRADYTLVADDVTFLNAVAMEMNADAGLVDPTRSRCHPVGNPAFDGLLSRRAKPDPARLSNWLPDSAAGKTVLHADMPAWVDPVTRGPHTKTETEILDEMSAVHAAVRAAGATYLVRPHPSQSRDLYEAFVARHADAHLATDPPLHDLLEAVDLVVVRSTTVGLEAVYLRQKVLQLDPRLHTDMPLAEMGVALGAQFGHELPEAVRSALGDDAAHQRRMARAREVLPRTPAADAIADLIVERSRGIRGTQGVDQLREVPD